MKIKTIVGLVGISLLGFSFNAFAGGDCGSDDKGPVLLCASVKAPGSDSHKYHVVVNGKGVPLNLCMGNGDTLGMSNTDVGEAMSIGYLNQGSNSVDMFICATSFCTQKVKVGSLAISVSGSKTSGYTVTPNAETVTVNAIPTGAPTCSNRSTKLLQGLVK